MNLDLFTVTPEEKPLDSLKGTCGFAGIFNWDHWGFPVFGGV